MKDFDYFFWQCTLIMTIRWYSWSIFWSATPFWLCECASINRVYGFYDECKKRFNVKLWKAFIDCFNCLSVAALIDEKILCMHGGLFPDLHKLDQIRSLQRPTDVPDAGLLCDLLWSDPSKDVQGWGWMTEEFRILLALTKWPSFFRSMIWILFAVLTRSQ